MGLFFWLIIFFFIYAVSQSDASAQIRRSRLGLAGKARGSWSIFDQIFSWSAIGPRPDLYLYYAFCLLAKLVKSDGVVTKREINAIDNFIKQDLGLNFLQREKVIKIFNQAKNSDKSFYKYAQEFRKHFNSQPALLVNMIEVLLHVAAADGAMSPAEEQMIDFAAIEFGLTDWRYSAMKNAYVHMRRGTWKGSGNKSSQSGFAGQQQSAYGYQKTKSAFVNESDRYYAILGCKKDSTEQEIKKKYRKLVMEHHPDRVVAKGIPEELMKVANSRFQEIQEAYEFVAREKGIK